MTFDPSVALGYAQSISRPRRVGSQGEQAVADEIAVRLQGLGYCVERQAFVFTEGGNLAIKAVVWMILSLVVATQWLQRGHLWAPALPALLILFLFLLSRRIFIIAQSASLAGPRAAWWDAGLKRFAVNHASENLIAYLPGQLAGEARTRLFLVAHYDSKTQSIPLVWRVALAILFIAGALAFSGLVILGILVPAFVHLATLPAVLVLIAGVPLAFLDSGNASPGAIDNASGTGLLLHLAEVLAARPGLGEHIDVRFLFTGAEELGLMGATRYVNLNRDWLRRPGVYVLNLDGIGTHGKLCLVGKNTGGDAGPQLVNLVQQACRELRIPLGRLNLPGMLYDHIPFTQAGCDAISLVTAGWASRVIHTPHDTPDRLDVGGFERAGRVVLWVIRRLGAGEGS